MRKKVLCRVLMLFVWVLAQTSSVYAQTKTVSGIISDQNGVPLEKATIKAKGVKAQAISDANGRFRLAVPEQANAIEVSYVGMKPVTVSIDGKETVLVTLNVADSKLNEVVVIGYGTVRRSDVSSAVSSVKAKDLKDLPVAGIDQAIQGKVAGVTVTNNSGQPGGGVSVKVRGVTTINSNDPLIVVDGVPFFNNTRSTTGYAGLGGSDGQTGNSVMASINPGDIESIDVLKDASAQAIYGSQAANGVILITTKKGKNGEGKVNYEMYYGQQQVQKKLDVMNLREFAQYQNEVLPVLGQLPTEEFKDPSILGEGTDWQDAIFRHGQIQNHQLSFSGGKDKTSYYLSMNYFNQEGILIGSDFKRYTLRFSLDHQLKNWLKIGFSTNATRNIQNVTLSDAAYSTIWWSAVQSPLIPVKNIDGTWGGGTNIGGVMYSQDNPVAKSHYRGNKGTHWQVFGNTYADIQLRKDLSFKTEFAYTLGLNNNIAYQNSGAIGPTMLQSQLFDAKSNNYYYALRTYLNYNKWFNKHAISATAGHEAQYSYYESINGKKVNLANNILDLNAGESNKQTWELGGGKNNWAMESWFARGSYTYDDRFSLSLSFRADASSNFGTNNRWGYFPGASLGWTVTNERFIEPAKNVLNYLKLRVGYGAVGNQNLPSGAPNPPYTSVIGFWPGPVGFGTSNYLNGISNPDLSWESVITKNAGFDASFLKGRIDLNVDVYKKTTSDMLLFLTGPSLIGVGDAWDDLKAPIGNVGQMSNTGIDISLTTTNIRNKDFTWKTTAIFTHYKNKLEKMAASTAGLTGKVLYNERTITYTKPGYAVGSFYGLVTDGLFRTQADLDNSMKQFNKDTGVKGTYFGDVRFKDVNGDKKVDAEDITFIGSPLPKFTYGLTNNFQYKDFDLSIFIQGSHGAKIYNFMRWGLERMITGSENQLRSVLDRYTKNNPNGKLPRFTNDNETNTFESDRYVENGSYLRIQNISFGYRLPKRILDKVKVSNLRVYVTVQNLKTFTDYSGYDPEVGSFNNSISLMNVDAGHYPNPRSFTIGANLEF